MGLCDFKMWLGEMWSIYCWWDKSARQIHIGVAGINFSYPHITVTRPPSKTSITPAHLTGHGWVHRMFNNSCGILLMWFENVDFNNLLILATLCLRQILPLYNGGKICWFIYLHLSKVFWYVDIEYLFTTESTFVSNIWCNLIYIDDFRNWLQETAHGLLTFPHTRNPHYFLLTIYQTGIRLAGRDELWLSSCQGRARSLMWKRSRYSNMCHGYKLTDLHENCGPKQLLLAILLLTNNMCAKFHTFLNSFGV